MTEGQPLLRASAASAILVLIAAIIVLAGWALGIEGMQTLGVGSVTVKANTALGLMAASLAILFLGAPPPISRRRAIAAGVLGALVLSIGVLTLAQYAFAVDLGIDQLLFKAPGYVGLTNTPGRMAAVTAFVFAALGAGILFTDRPKWGALHPGQLCYVMSGSIALMAVLGYVYGAIPTSGLGQGIQIAGTTAVGVTILSVCGIVIRPREAWMRTMTSDGAGGILARQLLPFAFGVPFALGAMRVAQGWFGAFSPANTSAITAVLTMIAFGTLIAWTARAINNAEKLRKRAESERVQMVLEQETARARMEAEHAARHVAEAARDAADKANRDKTEAFALLDVVLESAPLGFALYDLDLRYRRVNAALAAINGASTERHVGKRPRDMAPDVAGGVETVLRQVLETERPVVNHPVTGETRSRPGYRRHFLASFFPVHNADGKMLGIGALISETTDQKHLEAQLIQAQKMEAVGRLAGGVAHDFNNLLTVIRGYSDMAIQDLAEGNPLRGDMEEIRRAADRAAGLTSQLLSFSRKEVVQPRDIDVNEVVNGIDRMLRRLIGEDVDFVLSCSDTPAMVRADRGQLEQVLLNLALNARDAMPGGGRLQIATEHVTIGGDDGNGALRPGSYVLIAISDTGTGMSSDTMAHVFEPFFTTKEVGKGTGLGLSTVYGIVKQSQGEITVTSAIGSGTTFRIYLPRLVEKTPSDRTPARGMPRIGAGELILVVEDEDIVRAVTARALQRAGYPVLVAGTAGEALELCERHGDIALLLTDMVMPGMGGRELATRVQHHCPEVKVLFMSGYTEDTVIRDRIIEHGAEFIEKPFTPVALTKRIREVLDGGHVGAVP